MGSSQLEDGGLSLGLGALVQGDFLLHLLLEPGHFSTIPAPTALQRHHREEQGGNSAGRGCQHSSLRSYFGGRADEEGPK